MVLSAHKELECSAKAQNVARIIASEAKDMEKAKRIYSSVICMDALADYLISEGFSIKSAKNIFKIIPLAEKFEITDLYCNGWYLDVRVIVNKKYILIPREHTTYNISPDFYVAAEFDRNTRTTKIVGFIKPDEINRSKVVEHYYAIDKADLRSTGELEEILKNEKEIMVNDVNHHKYLDILFNILDGVCDSSDAAALVRHLITCKDCRESLVEFYDFEKMVGQLKNNQDILDDYKSSQMADISSIDTDSPLHVLYNGTETFKENAGEITAPKVVETVLQEIIKPKEKNEEIIKESPKNEEEQPLVINPDYYDSELPEGQMEHEEEIDLDELENPILKNEVFDNGFDVVDVDLVDELPKKEDNQSKSDNTSLIGSIAGTVVAAAAAGTVGHAAQVASDTLSTANEFISNTQEMLSNVESDDLLLIDEESTATEEAPQEELIMDSGSDDLLLIDEEPTAIEEAPQEELTMDSGSDDLLLTDEEPTATEEAPQEELTMDSGSDDLLLTDEEPTAMEEAPQEELIMDSGSDDLLLTDDETPVLEEVNDDTQENLLQVGDNSDDLVLIDDDADNSISMENSQNNIVLDDDSNNIDFIEKESDKSDLSDEMSFVRPASFNFQNIEIPSNSANVKSKDNLENNLVFDDMEILAADDLGSSQDNDDLEFIDTQNSDDEIEIIDDDFDDNSSQNNYQDDEDYANLMSAESYDSENNNDYDSEIEEIENSTFDYDDNEVVYDSGNEELEYVESQNIENQDVYYDNVNMSNVDMNMDMSNMDVDSSNQNVSDMDFDISGSDENEFVEDDVDNQSNDSEGNSELYDDTDEEYGYDTEEDNNTQQPKKKSNIKKLLVFSMILVLLICTAAAITIHILKKEEDVVVNDVNSIKESILLNKENNVVDTDVVDDSEELKNIEPENNSEADIIEKVKSENEDVIDSIKEDLKLSEKNEVKQDNVKPINDGENIVKNPDNRIADALEKADELSQKGATENSSKVFEPTYKLSKLNWAVAPYLVQDDMFKAYIKNTGKRVQLILKRNMFNVVIPNDISPVTVKISISPDTKIAEANILKSSGSKQVDNIVLQSVNSTFNDVPLPVLLEDTLKTVKKNTGDSTIKMNLNLVFEKNN